MPVTTKTPIEDSKFPSEFILDSARKYFSVQSKASRMISYYPSSAKKPGVGESLLDPTQNSVEHITISVATYENVDFHITEEKIHYYYSFVVNDLELKNAILLYLGTGEKLLKPPVQVWSGEKHMLVNLTQGTIVNKKTVLAQEFMLKLYGVLFCN